MPNTTTTTESAGTAAQARPPRRSSAGKGSPLGPTITAAWQAARMQIETANGNTDAFNPRRETGAGTALVGDPPEALLVGPLERLAGRSA